MLRISVVLLVAGNLLLLGLHVSDASPVDPLADAPAWHMPAGAQRLQLASELPPPQPQPALRRQCFSAGPFETVPALVAAREALPAGVLLLTERESEALVEQRVSGMLIGLRSCQFLASIFSGPNAVQNNPVKKRLSEL